MNTRIYNIGGIITYDIDLDDTVLLSHNTILIKDENICEIGDDLKGDFDSEIDAKGMFLTPGFIDSHTHLIFSSNRSEDFNSRISGISYSDIHKSGGGIKSSIKSLKDTNKDDLVKYCLTLSNRMIKTGTTTLEVKSGYGLSIEDEIKSLEVINELNEISKLDLIPTFMGAHDFPEGINRDDYVDIITSEMIPEVSRNNLAEFCDVFCEEGYFDNKQTTKICNVATEFGLKIKLHVDEFIDSNGAYLAGELNAVSADHLMKSNFNGLKNMAKNNVVATLLPGTTLFLGLKTFADGKQIKKAGCDLALASDFNPGSSTIYCMPTIMAIASLYCGLSIKDSFKGVTYNAAKALTRQDSIGLIKDGYKADILFWDINNIYEIPYWFNSDRLLMIMKNGKLI